MISKPTLILDKNRCKKNIQEMANKAKRNNTIFRPHFKTHQSHEIGRWFSEEGVNCITVSSLDMAIYFAQDGWRNITVAFPVNILEISKINELAKDIKLNLLIESPNVVRLLSKQLKTKINVFLKIDIGYQRTGIEAGNFKIIDEILSEISNSSLISFKCPPGYHIRKLFHIILAVYNQHLPDLMETKNVFI